MDLGSVCATRRKEANVWIVGNRRHFVCWGALSSAGMKRGKGGMKICPAVQIFLTVSQRQHGQRGRVRLAVGGSQRLGANSHSRRGGPP